MHNSCGMQLMFALIDDSHLEHQQRPLHLCYCSVHVDKFSAQADKVIVVLIDDLYKFAFQNFQVRLQL